MQAIILAAGMGRRLNDLTKDCTKCMVEINGVSLIDRLLSHLSGFDLTKIIIVVGYKKESLISHIDELDIKTKIQYVCNDEYMNTNNIYSFYLARQYLSDEETLVFESDVIFEKEVLSMLIESPYDNIALVDKYKSWMTGVGVLKGEKNELRSFVKEDDINYNQIEECYKTVGIYKFTSDFLRRFYFPFLEAYIDAYGKQERYEDVLRIVSLSSDLLVTALSIEGLSWYEINDIQDIDLASTLFADNDFNKVDLMFSRWGGYWRYPNYLDYFYLVTPYYPPKKMIDEIKGNFESLLEQYPSGMKVNSLLAAKEFKVHTENIVIGNGAAELIKSLMGLVAGRVGFIKPSFEEYINRFSQGEKIELVIESDDFKYSAEDIISFFQSKKMDWIVIINPDNPSGNYIPKKDMIFLVRWAKQYKIRILVDESFVDFADETDGSLIEQEILDEFENLYIVKSISKSYGVPGMRLGVLATGDKDAISFIKKDVSIWNINSFGEFFMQILGKYKKEYFEALERFRVIRNKLYTDLSAIPHIRVFQSQANYIMVELLDGINADDLKKYMLIRKHIFIKSLNKKITSKRQCIRLAIRNEKENAVMVRALREELNYLVQKDNTSDYVFVFDLDSTITAKEILPEIASKIGKLDEVRRLTEATMMGDIPFKTSFIRRVKVLSETSVSEVKKMVSDLPLNDEIVDFIKSNKERCYVVTGNLDIWIETLMKKIGMEQHCYCSKADVVNDKIQKIVSVVDKEMICRQFVQPIVMIGDGDNDSGMAKCSDISIGFGGVRNIAPSLLSNIDYAFFDEKICARFLWELL